MYLVYQYQYLNNYLIIGARYKDNGYTDSGTVYIFKKNKIIGLLDNTYNTELIPSSGLNIANYYGIWVDLNVNKNDNNILYAIVGSRTYK